MAVRDEIIRLLLEMEGEQDVAKLTRALRDLETQGGETGATAGKLADEFEQLQAVDKAVSSFVKLKASLADTDARLEQAKAGLAALNAEFSDSDRSSSAVSKQYARAEQELARLTEQQRRQTLELQRASGALAKAGVDTNKLAAAQRDARAGMGDIATRARELGQRLRETASAQDAINKSAERGTGIFGRLRGAVAGLGAYLGIREAVQGVKNLLAIGDAAERAQIRLAALYGSQEAGNRAGAELRTLSRDNALAFEAVADAAAKLKTFGLEPLDGTLQSLIDQNAKLGGSQETLEGIILAVGQAWAKQKLQGEEILQLVERGVPVWDLLQKATGKNVTELQKLSEQGKLGRDVIKALLEEIGQASEGSAAAGLGTLTGLLQRARNTAEDFFRAVNDQGLLRYFKERLDALNTEVDRMVRDGRFAQYARQLSDAITGTARAIEGAARFVAEYSGALFGVAKAYLAVKAAQSAANLLTLANSWRLIAAQTAAAGTAAAGTAGVFGRLGGLIRGLPGSIKIGLIVAGYEVLDSVARKVAEIAASNSEAAKSLEAANAARAAQVQAEINQLRLAQVATVQFRQEQIKSAQEVAALSADELASYKLRIAGAQQFAQQQLAIALREQEIAGNTRETEAAVASAAKRLQELRAGWGDVAAGAKLASSAIERGLSVAAAEVITQLGDMEGAASQATTKVAGLFATFETDSTTRIGDVALALASVGNESTRAGENVRKGLSAALAKLSGEDLLKFQGAAQAAFEEFGTSAEDSAVVAETVLLTALERLGVKGDALGVQFTDAGKDIVASFQTVAESATASGAQIEAAFKAALASVTTSGEAEALGTAIEAAAARGQVSLEATSRAATALAAKLREIEAATDPLTDAFERLGVTSQRELDNTARSAAEAFEQIVQGAQRGQAATEDVRRAFVAYAQAQLNAVQNSSAWERQQVEGALRARAAALNLVGALDEVGLAGRRAGAAVADGADEATRALLSAESAANGLAASNVSVANTFVQVGDQAAYTSGQIDGVSEKFKELIADQNLYQGGGGQIFFDLNRQSSELEKQLQLIKDQNAAYDPLEQRVRDLRAQYELLGDDRLRQLAQEQMRLEENQRREQEALDARKQALAEERKAQEELRKQTEPARRVAAPLDGVQRVELVMKNEQRPGSILAELNDGDIDQIAQRVIAAIDFSRMGSM